MKDERPIVVIGSGTAGNQCARRLAQAGRRVVQAESGERVGGTCLWYGCMPKKALFNAASSRRLVERMEQFGVVAAGVRLDWPSVLAWKWHAQETYAGDQEGIARDFGIDLVRAPARFVSPTEIDVGGEIYDFSDAVIATGSEPVRLDVPGVGLADTSLQALSYPDVPARLAIVGSGFIAMEFAGMFATFGSQVTVLMRGDRILRAQFDEEVSALARTALEDLGVTFMEHVALDSLAQSGDAIDVRFTRREGGGATLEVDRVLMAVGRRAALGDLGIAEAGLETDERGRLEVDEHLRTSNPHVWVGGDAAGGPQFTPVASQNGRQIAAAILGHGLPEPDYSYIPSGCFTVPQLASVGMTEDDAQSAGVDYRVARVTPEYLGAAIIGDERKGLIKVVVDPDARILGAQIAGHDAVELIYGYALAIRMSATAHELADVLPIHPSYSEILNWAVS
jgi:pyruvate/2-oxoglutarate dehydrogenase complex dihydrolipoamide dehydrogenase (E3) component